MCDGVVFAFLVVAQSVEAACGWSPSPRSGAWRHVWESDSEERRDEEILFADADADADASAGALMGERCW